MAYEIIRNDITRERADAIVTLPHRTPEIGNGVDKAIHAKAGPRLLEAREALGVIEPGDAWTTPAFGLDARWVIHALGPIRGLDDANEHQLLQMSYAAILREALLQGAKSVAIPLVSAGNYGYPVKVALDNAVKAIEKFLAHYPELSVRLIVFEAQAYAYAKEKWPNVTSAKIDDNYVAEYQRRSPQGRRRLTEDEPNGYYQDIEPVVSVLSFRDLFVRYSDRFMKAERARKKRTRKIERGRFRGADRRAGEVDGLGYFTTLADIARRAGADYAYVKNLRSSNHRPSRQLVEDLGKAIELSPTEMRRFLEAAGHASGAPLS